MMQPDQSFEELMTRLRAGDDRAAEEVFYHFANRLIALARTRLDRLLTSKVDPEDVVQSVYRSFFRHHAEGRYQIDGWDGLWGMLTVIALRKCGHRVEYLRACKRDVRRETKLTADNEFVWPARDPSPSHAARMVETVERVMRALEPRERDILSLSLQGHDSIAISDQIGRSERTVQRVLKRVRELLCEIQAET